MDIHAAPINSPQAMLYDPAKDLNPAQASRQPGKVFLLYPERSKFVAQYGD
jgi:hypothetical protein